MKWNREEIAKKLKASIWKIVKYGSIGIVVIAIVSYLAAEYTSRPNFCTSCHIMKPYFVSWEESNHKDVSCVECHIPPGVTYKIKAKYQALGMVAKYYTQTYGSKPWAEISDSACLREGCHETRLLEGKVKFGKVTFDHKPHLTEMRRGLKLRCTSCHSQIVQGEHITVTPSSCVLCHFKGLQENKPISGCPSCHAAPDKVIEYQGIKFDHQEAVSRGISCERCHIDVVVGDGAVPKQKCFTCHNETWKLDKFFDTSLIHENHVSKHSIDCLHCHVEIQHKINKMSETVSINCQTCHPDHHVAQKEMYMGMGGKGPHEHRIDPMFQAQVSCAGCHTQPHGDEVTNITKKASGESCASCHGSEYRTMLSGWQTRLNQLISQIRPVLNRAKQEVTKNKKAKEILAEAEYNLRFVEYGKGVHNIRYAQELLETAERQIQQALQTAKSTYKPPIITVIPTAATKECYSCHIGIENHKVQFGDLPVPHGLHLEKAKLACLNCHKSTEEKHGMVLVKKNDCKNCHHAQKEPNCSACHSREYGLYTGKLSINGVKAKPNVMAENVPCMGCHTDITKPGGLETIKKACVDCHDENYAGMVDAWQENTMDGIKELDNLYKPVANIRWSDPAKQQKIGEIKEIMNALKNDKTKGAHNLEYMDSLISEAKKLLVELNKELPKTTKK